MSAFSHLLGAAAFLLAAPRLLARSPRSTERLAALGIYVFGLAFMLAMSGLYHLHAPGEAKEYFRRWDHVGIWVVIAGCFTPVHIILFRGFWRWAPLIFVWIAAIAGLITKLWFFDMVSRPLSVSLYATLSAFGMGTAALLVRERGLRYVRCLLACGGVYLIGGVMFFFRWPNPWPGVVGHHELWHGAVLAASAFHWAFVGQVVTEPDPERVGVPAPTPQPESAGAGPEGLLPA